MTHSIPPAGNIQPPAPQHHPHVNPHIDFPQGAVGPFVWLGNMLMDGDGNTWGQIDNPPAPPIAPLAHKVHRAAIRGLREA